MAWRRLGDKPWSGPMMVGLPAHICVTRPQWVKTPRDDASLFSFNENKTYRLLLAGDVRRQNSEFKLIEVNQSWFKLIKLISPSAAYMRQWAGSALIQVMACSRFGAPSHYLIQCWLIVNRTVRNKLYWNFNRNSTTFIHENAFENIVCEMADILFGGYGSNTVMTDVMCPIISMRVWRLTMQLRHIINTLWSRLFADNILKCVFGTENNCSSISNFTTDVCSIDPIDNILP